MTYIDWRIERANLFYQDAVRFADFICSVKRLLLDSCLR